MWMQRYFIGPDPMMFEVLPPRLDKPDDWRNTLAYVESVLDAAAVDSIYVPDLSCPEPGITRHPRSDALAFAQAVKTEYGGQPTVSKQVHKIAEDEVLCWAGTALDAGVMRAIFVGGQESPDQYTGCTVEHAMESVHNEFGSAIQLGGVSLPNRKRSRDSERIRAKAPYAGFFVTQVLYETGTMEQVIDELGEPGQKVVIYISVAPLKDANDIGFIKGKLRGYIPGGLEHELNHGEMEEKSMRRAGEVIAGLRSYAAEKKVRLGVNVEYLRTRNRWLAIEL